MSIEVAVIGAGPYGLSIASHLRAYGIDHRVFGRPMQTWRTQMPKGMYLKSEGFASSLYHPDREYTLAEHCASQGIAYADEGLPVALDTFNAYGLAFQERLVPHLEQSDVVGLAEDGRGAFRITLEGGEELSARRVVMAVGISRFAHIPGVLQEFPRELVSHSAHHNDLSIHAGREIAVLGAGASAIDCAALLCMAGAKVHLVARTPSLRFHGAPSLARRPLVEQLRAPQSGLGPGWKSRLCTDAPLVFYQMPDWFRAKVVQKHLGPAASWWTKQPVTETAELHLDANIESAEEAGGRIRLHLSRGDGGRTQVVCDHVIAGTGYHPHLDRLPFMSRALRDKVRTFDDSPLLSTHFESSVPNLYFTGLASAINFGPLVRFAFGAGFTSRRLSRRLLRQAGRRQVAGGPSFGLASNDRLPLADAA